MTSYVIAPMRSMAILFLLMCVFASLVVVLAQECDPTTEVCDRHERCSVWKDEGECVRNKNYMKQHCPVTCGFLHEIYESSSSSASAASSASAETAVCADRHDRCPVWARLGECDSNPDDMHKYCPESCDVCGDRPRGSLEKQALNKSDKCVDKEKRCSAWAKSGECVNNPKYMHFNCAKSCGTCDKILGNRRNVEVEEDDEDENDDEHSSDTATTTQEVGTTVISVAYARNLVDRSKKLGEEQKAEGADREKILQRIESTIEYFATDAVAKLPIKIRRECKNRHELCTFWQVIGECEKNKAYMQTNCAAACQSCDMIDHEQRCPKNPEAVPALIPGGLNQMFQRIVRTAPGNRTSDMTPEELQALKDSGTPLYSVQVHSRPSLEPLTAVDAAQDKSLPPWVITMENFLTDAECENLIALGYKYKYKRSEDVGRQKFDGTFDSVKSESRTSENAWCSDREGCRSEEVPKRVFERMAKVMGIPPENSEDLQILKYEVGQFYRTHHDYIPHQKDRQCGPRILTFFLYLSDVEEGGGTNFPRLNVTVMPKKGRALLWPSVLDSDPTAKDHRMDHQALPVEVGTKFAANGWIHLYDYLGPQTRGCN